MLVIGYFMISNANSVLMNMLNKCVVSKTLCFNYDSHWKQYIKLTWSKKEIYLLNS